MRVEDVARIVHEANRAYCAVHNDTTQPNWDDASEWMIVSAIAGVNQVLNDPLMTPEKLHEEWCALKVKDGWVYGDAKDGEKKTHPCLVPYAELPKMQQMKDHLFRAIVEVFRDQVRK